MLRYLLALTIPSVALLVGCGGQSNNDRPVVRENLPSFDFRGLIPGFTTVKLAKASGVVRNCFSTSDNQTHCSFKDNRLAGYAGYGSGTVVFKDGKFDWFSLTPGSEAYTGIFLALDKVYGPSCDTKREVLQNAFGAKFESETTTWCFSQGKLTLRERSTIEGLGKGDFEFFTKHTEEDEERSEELKNYTSQTL